MGGYREWSKAARHHIPLWFLFCMRFLKRITHFTNHQALIFFFCSFLGNAGSPEAAGGSPNHREQGDVCPLLATRHADSALRRSESDENEARDLRMS